MTVHILLSNKGRNVEDIFKLAFCWMKGKGVFQSNLEIYQKLLTVLERCCASFLPGAVQVLHCSVCCLDKKLRNTDKELIA